MFVDKLEENKILELYNSGFSMRSIAKKRGFDYNSVRCSLIANKSKMLFRRKVGGRAMFEGKDQVAVAKEYKAGATFSFLAKKYRTSPSSIVTAVVNSGVDPRRSGKPHNFSESDFNFIKQRWLAGDNTTAIASKFKVSASTIDRRLRDLGVDTSRRPIFRTAKNRRQSQYVLVRIYYDDPFYPMANKNGMVLEHRLTMARYLGRLLHRWETVHHKDRVPFHNKITNLQLRIGHHGTGAVYRCMDCGSHRLEPEEI